MRKLVRSTALTWAVLGSIAGATIAVPAQAETIEHFTCVYNCGAGPDGTGGVPADEYEACVRICDEFYGSGNSGG